MANSEETRVCKVCGNRLPLTHEYYSWGNKNKGTYQTTCKKCANIYARERRLAIKAENGERLERDKKSKQKYVENNREAIREHNRKYYNAHKEEICKKNRIKNGRRYWGDEVFAERTGWDISQAPSEHRYESGKSEELLSKTREWRKRNSAHVTEYQKEYCKLKYHNDPLHHAVCRVRNTINLSFYRCGAKKSKKNVELTGMTSRELYEYLLKTFEETYGYAWDHREPVHIDHIVPLCTATTTEEVEKLCHYTNLRLIKAKDNLKKGGKLDYEIANE